MSTAGWRLVLVVLFNLSCIIQSHFTPTTLLSIRLPSFEQCLTAFIISYYPICCHKLTTSNLSYTLYGLHSSIYLWYQVEYWLSPSFLQFTLLSSFLLTAVIFLLAPCCIVLMFISSFCVVHHVLLPWPICCYQLSQVKSSDNTVHTLIRAVGCCARFMNACHLCSSLPLSFGELPQRE